MNNVLIRPLEVGDAQISWKWRNDSEIWKYTGSRPDKYITFETEDTWIRQALSQNDAVRFAIMADNIYVGNIQLTNINADDAQYHIFIGNQNYWGKGIATLATQQILRYAKNTLQLKRVYLNVDSYNIAAVKAYEKCNFVKVSDEVKMEIDLQENINPKLSVFMMIYNHGEFLSKAIDGILKQKCLFDFEIVVGEDFSKDNSRKILLEYADKYPGKFKLLLHSNNVGAHKNQEIVFENCTGEYIAICEGDDYWTDPYKLQKQVDFLNANPDFGLSHTNYSRFIQSSQEFIFDGVPYRTDDPFYGQIKGQYPIGTLTTVFRKEIWKKYMEDIDPFSKDWLMGDLPFWIYLSKFYKVHYFNENTAVYRVLEESASNTKQIDKMIRFDKSIKEIKLFFLDKYGNNNISDKKIKKSIESFFIYRQIIANATCKGNLKNFFSLLFQFYRINRNPKYFIGSFKQIGLRLF